MKVVRFPAHKAAPAGLRKPTAEPCAVIILPVVRIERFEPETPRQRRAARAIMRRYEQAKRDAEAT